MNNRILMVYNQIHCSYTIQTHFNNSVLHSVAKPVLIRVGRLDLQIMNTLASFVWSMVLVLNGISEMGAHVRINLNDLICLWHFIPAYHILIYHLIKVLSKATLHAEAFHLYTKRFLFISNTSKL